MPQIIRNLNGIKASTTKNKDMKRSEDVLYVITREDRDFLDYLKGLHKEGFIKFLQEKYPESDAE